MKRFLYFLIVVHSALFSGELSLYYGHDESDIVACYKHTIPELILDSKLKNTDDHDDIKKDDFLLLKIRGVQRGFNTLIENTAHIRHAIGSGKMANLLPYFFQGLPQRPQYKTPLNPYYCATIHSIPFVGPIILYDRLFNMSKVNYTIAIALSNVPSTLLLLRSPQYLQFLTSVSKIIGSPYFYHQWKKEQNKHDIIAYNLEFVTNRENTLLSKSFEDLLVQHCFDTDVPWYEQVLFNPRPLKTIYGEIVHIERCDETISYPNWPAGLEISVITKEYKPQQVKHFKLIDFSDEFEAFSETSYKNELPCNFIVDIKIVPKTGDPIAWNHTLNKIDIEAWFKEFCSKYDNMVNKKTILSCRVHQNYFDPETGEMDQELSKNIEFTQTLFSNRYNVVNL